MTDDRPRSDGGADPSPAMALLDLITGKWVAQALAVAARLGIADLLADGPRPCDELARANQVDAGALYRLLRALASVGVFAEVGERQFALTPMAEFLRSGVPGSLRGMATYQGEEAWWRPWGDLFASVKTGEPAFDRLFNTDLFSYLAEHPAVGAIFDDAMTGWSATTARAVADAYDFGEIGTLVDVGGGHGMLLSTILEAHPAPLGILYDLPQVVEGARERIEAAGLSGRCSIVGGSFFESVPPGGDAYILRHIIHDWDDERAAAILGRCRRALGEGGRLLLVESVIPPGNGRSLGKLVDLEMLVMAGGRERNEAEYRELLAGSGFRLTRVVPTASPLSIVEAEPA